MEEWKRSGQIPAFGDWKTANELPITQYFDCARQAGLIRYSNSSGECDRPLAAAAVDHHRFYAADYQKHPPPPPPSRNNFHYPAPRKTRLREKRGGAAAQPAAHVKDRKHGRVRDATPPTAADPPPRKPRHHQQKQQKHSSTTYNDAVPQRARIPVRPPKPVDEDLYKIPPELLLRSSKRKKMPGFLLCFVPSACAS